jgi:hypothetical protein
MIAIQLTFKQMIICGFVLVGMCIVGAVLAILLDKGSYMRSYSRWKKGK